MDIAPPSTLSTDDRAHVEKAVRRSGTSFYWAMRLLPPAKRAGMFAVYAFCREVDDIADDPDRIENKLLRLAEWRREIDRLYDGRPGHPVSRALLEPADRFALRREDFLHVIDGMEMDAAERIRIADCDQLGLYCDRVACAVGRLSVRVFGLVQPSGDHLAHCLGNALQLTNILRDLKEDARRDRVYLPGDLLRRYGIPEIGDAEEMLRHGAVAHVCEDIASRALRCFGDATTLVRSCDRTSVRPALIMMEVYRRTLRQLSLRGWRRWAEPVSVSSAEKLWVALRYGVI